MFKISQDDFTAFTSAIANIFLRKKFIFDIFDYISGERKSILQRFICKLQNWIINVANATIICTEERRRQIRPSHPKKLVVIHNSPPKSSSDYKVCKSPSAKIKVCYVGILQDFRLLKEIPNFFKSHLDFELHIGGFGKYENLYSELAKKHSNIIYYGRLSYSDTLKLEQQCDIMLAIYDPKIENHTYAAPNKFYESLMLGKPVIMAKDTGMSNIVEEHNLGETIDYSIKGFSEGMLRLREKRQHWPDISKRMNQLYTEYSWDEMKKRLWQLYDEIL